MLVYRYDASEDKTYITLDNRKQWKFDGKLDYKRVHEMYDTLVFEIILPEIIPSISNEQED